MHACTHPPVVFDHINAGRSLERDEIANVNAAHAYLYRALKCISHSSQLVCLHVLLSSVDPANHQLEALHSDHQIKKEM